MSPLTATQRLLTHDETRRAKLWKYRGRGEALRHARAGRITHRESR